jgi:hypothetical protein
LVQPIFPNGNRYTLGQKQAVANGINDALAHIENEDCAYLYFPGSDDPTEEAATLLEDTMYRMYRLLSLPSGVGAWTVGAPTPSDPSYSTNVTINTDGAFFNAGPNPNGTESVTMPNSSGVSTSFTFASLSTFGRFLLLHELGHQVGVFGPDSASAGANGANSQAVLNDCFQQDALGVYH